MKKIVMLISLVIFGLVFSGCAAKDTRAAKMNEMNTTNFAENMITSGNPILMGIGADVGVVTLNGITENEMRNRFKALPEDEKEKFATYMRECMIERSVNYYNEIYKDEPKIAKQKVEHLEYYNNLIDVKMLNTEHFWNKGTSFQKHFRNECDADYPRTEVVTEQATVEQQTEAQNQTSTNQDEKVEEKQETKN